MGNFKIIITKEVDFQGRKEQFSNVYTLSTGVAEAFDDGAAIDSIVELERAVHTQFVRFVRAESYGVNPVTGDNPRFGKDLAVVGTMPYSQMTYYECAVLVQFELPRSGGLIGIGRKRRLKKWLHSGALGGAETTEQVRGSAALSVAQKARFMDSYATPLMNQEHGGGRLAALNGDLPSSAAVHDYLEHRQFHQGKKRSTNLI